MFSATASTFKAKIVVYNEAITKLYILYQFNYIEWKIKYSTEQ